MVGRGWSAGGASLLAWAFVSVLLHVACDGDNAEVLPRTWDLGCVDGSDEACTCVPGDIRSCYSDTCAGSQTCGADERWGACQCCDESAGAGCAMLTSTSTIGQSVRTECHGNLTDCCDGQLTGCCKAGLTDCDDDEGPDEAVWYPDEAKTRGEDCDGDVDTFVIANGPEIAIAFSNLRVDLSKPDHPLEDRAKCKVEVPVDLPKRQYPAEITQAITYGALKTPGATGTISVRSELKDVDLRSLRRSFPAGEFVNIAFLTEFLTTPLDPGSDAQRKWCRHWSHTFGGRDEYQVKAEIEGMRPGTTEALIMAIDGISLRLDMSLSWKPCD